MTRVFLVLVLLLLILRPNGAAPLYFRCVTSFLSFDIGKSGNGGGRAAHLNSRDAANQIAFLFPRARAGERGAGETGATPARSEVSLVTCNFSRAAERARFRGDSHSSSKP